MVGRSGDTNFVNLRTLLIFTAIPSGASTSPDAQDRKRLESHDTGGIFPSAAAGDAPGLGARCQGFRFFCPTGRRGLAFSKRSRSVA